MEIKNKQFLVNGQPVLLKGANRHEMSAPVIKEPSLDDLFETDALARDLTCSYRTLHLVVYGNGVLPVEFQAFDTLWNEWIRTYNMLYGPGNDLVSATAMTAAGAHMILFTTGRGTPFGAPAPTLKLATNSQLAERKKGWIDFDAGPIADGETIDDAAKRLLQLVIEVAGGKQTKAEEKGFREISIFKDGNYWWNIIKRDHVSVQLLTHDLFL